MRRLTRACIALALVLPVSGAAAAPAAAAPARVFPDVPVAATSSPACPAGYAAPRADRPVLDLRFDLSTDRTRFNGLEHIEFTPDLATDRVVLRQWVNDPGQRADGAHGHVSRVAVSGAVQTTRLPANDGSTYVIVPLPRTVAAGSRLVIDVRFHVTLPRRGTDRIGSDGQTAWWGSGHPLLAWERGVGWATDRAGTLWGERTTSEDALLRTLAVRTGVGDDVLATGRLKSNRLISATRRERVFTANSVRDAMVAVGRFRVSRRLVGVTPVIVGSAPNVADNPAAVAAVIADSMAAYARLLGPFPYADLSVVVLPRLTGGIEFPGAIMLGAGEYRDPTGSHEVAHEYFYGLVGNNQARDPWLDEGFATYAEALHHGTASRYTSMTIPADARGRVGRPMSYWENRQGSYYRGVYVQGGAALLRARQAAGPLAFDTAIRCYVRRRAHTIARPGDLATALAGLPAALHVLRSAGALP
ncbi:MAG: hypothetical protein ABIM89_17955 [Mycobacteriales bacterium]